MREVFQAFVVSDRDRSEVIELVEEAFDELR
jgi:hypothetical protein